MKRLLLFLLVVLVSHVNAEEHFIMAKCDSPFPEAMMFIQNQLTRLGYEISRVQHVDKGLKGRGYKTMRYRIVFFGNPKDMELIKKKYPVLIPFFPFNVTVFEKKDYTGISTLDPMVIHHLYAQDILPERFKQWSADIHYLVKIFKTCDDT